MSKSKLITDLIEDSKLKFIFVGGKGGVGKTTCSSAISSQLAYKKRVLLISTDPAHSLSDAFRTKFGDAPRQVPDIPNLEVMEVNPASFLRSEIESWTVMAQNAGMTEVVGKVAEFQEWLSSVPGIDEATALSSVIDLIESGKYDVVVFDTAPTGHTLKLLQLPAVLEAGLSKLESWQATLWSWWELVKGSNPIKVKRQVSSRIKTYKKGIERVGMMLKDNHRTKFVVVCISEFLSVSESQRLLIELEKFKVCASHIIVNQLIPFKIGEDDLKKVVVGTSGTDTQAARDKVTNIVTLSNSRHSIQQRYLTELKKFPQVQGKLEVIEVPLLPKEVTGPAQLLEFSRNLVPQGYNSTPFPQKLKAPEAERRDGDSRSAASGGPAKNGDSSPARVRLFDDSFYDTSEFYPGDKVIIVGLSKNPQYNAQPAQVVNVGEDGRVAVRISEVSAETGRPKIISLRAVNIQLVEEGSVSQDERPKERVD